MNLKDGIVIPGEGYILYNFTYKKFKNRQPNLWRTKNQNSGCLGECKARNDWAEVPGHFLGGRYCSRSLEVWIVQVCAFV